MENKFIDPYVYKNGVLKNKFNIQDQKELDRVELTYCYNSEFEFIKRSINEEILLDSTSIFKMHFILFNRLYDFAGKLRTVNISKGTMFAPVQYLQSSLDNLWEEFENSDKTTDDILKYYRELNFVHPFREGNGRSGRLLLQLMYIKYNRTLIDFSKIDKNDYLNLMIESVINPGNENLSNLKALFINAEIKIHKISPQVLRCSIRESLQYEYEYDITPILEENYVQQPLDNSLEKEQLYISNYEAWFPKGTK